MPKKTEATSSTPALPTEDEAISMGAVAFASLGGDAPNPLQLLADAWQRGYDNAQRDYKAQNKERKRLEEQARAEAAVSDADKPGE